MAKLISKSPTTTKGRMPIAARQTEIAEMNELRASGDIFQVSLELQAELKEKGLAYRFINRKKYIEEHGFHKGGWVAFKRDLKAKPTDSLDFSSGTDAEGYVRRGDQVLAVKPIAEHEKFKRILKRKKQLYLGQNKLKAEELREMARAAGADMTVEEGYEEDGESEE